MVFTQHETRLSLTFPSRTQRPRNHDYKMTNLISLLFISTRISSAQHFFRVSFMSCFMKDHLKGFLITFISQCIHTLS